MPSPSAYQCLFCNHLNPVGASFCNECGSQLQLQQCDLCGSINKRSARVCYKCGAAFTFASPLGAGAAMLDHCPAAAMPDGAHTTLPESLAAALSARYADGGAVSVPGGVPKSSSSLCIEDVPVVDPAQTRDDALSLGSTAAIGSPSGVAAVAASRFDFRHPLALVAGLLLLIMAAALVMHGLSGPLPSSSTPSPGTPPAGGEPSPAATRSPAGQTESEVSAAAHVRVPQTVEAGATAVGHETAASGAIDETNEANEARGDPAGYRATEAKACLPNVAALGLCDGALDREKK